MSRNAAITIDFYLYLATTSLRSHPLAFAFAGAAISHIDGCATSLEAAGAGILQRRPETEIGVELVNCGNFMIEFAASIQRFAPDCKESQESSQRMAFAADRMILAGTELQGTTEKPKGKKAWLKGNAS